jgi:peptidoglycan/LPS O-acetylase OafA/YrhL
VSAHVDAAVRPAAARELPPVTQIAVVAMALIVVGGITMASRLPSPPLPLLIGLLAAAVALLAVDLVLLARLRDFAWRPFFTVAKWTALAYLVMYGMLEFTFIYDKVPGSTLTVLTLMLLVIAIDVPMLFGFTVARYADPD